MRDSIQLRSRHRQAGDEQHPTGVLHLDGFESLTTVKIADTRMGICYFWQRMRDSNPRKRSQSPVCYRYTNPLYAIGGDNRTRTCDLMRVKHRRACRPDPQRSNQPITVGTRRFFGFHDCADCVVIHNQTS